MIMLIKFSRIFRVRCSAFDADCAEFEMKDLFRDEERQCTANLYFNIVTYYIEGNLME